MVHRITNRWGYVRQPTPERTMLALEEKLPQKYWVEINRLLVPFGKHVCTGKLPRCSTWPRAGHVRAGGCRGAPLSRILVTGLPAALEERRRQRRAVEEQLALAGVRVSDAARFELRPSPRRSGRA